jgi:phospholipase/carboxylesterase
LGLAPYLDERLLIVSARAPYPFGGGFGGYAWYDIEEIGTPKLEAFKHSLGLLKRFIGEATSGYPADPERLYLMGFSMGTVMSYAVALTEPQMVSGVVAHSGYVPEVPGVTFKLGDLGGKSFFIAHGTYDRIIPVGLGRAARDLLAGTPAEATYKEYPMDHQIGEESLRDLASWLQGQL